MKSLYITSIEAYSGKTAACLALGKRFQADGFRVGYLKPLSLRPWRVSGRIADEDSVFVKESLGLSQPVWELAPVVVTPDFLRARLRGEAQEDLMARVRQAYEAAGENCDILLLEGGASLREGYAFGLPTPKVAAELSSHVLVVVKYRSEVRLLDDALSANARLGNTIAGILLNHVPQDSMQFTENLAKPFLEQQGLPVLGIIPEVKGLAAISVGELVEVLGAQVLTEKSNPNALVETLTVGAMTAETALHIFRNQTNKAVITGGDRTDIQLAALETSTACLILTGNLHPNPLILKQADNLNVPILLVPDNTMETVEKIEHIFGKTRLGQPAKLAQFQRLLEPNLDMERLYQTMGLR